MERGRFLEDSLVSLLKILLRAECPTQIKTDIHITHLLQGLIFLSLLFLKLPLDSNPPFFPQYQVCDASSWVSILNSSAVKKDFLLCTLASAA